MSMTPMGDPSFDVLLFDEAQTEVIRLVTNKINRKFPAHVQPWRTPDRYTDVVYYMGGDSPVISFNGALIPHTDGSWPSVGANWVTSSGSDPVPTLLKWERTGTRLTYKDEVGILTSVNIDAFGYRLIEGEPLTLKVMYTMRIKSGVTA